MMLPGPPALGCHCRNIPGHRDGSSVARLGWGKASPACTPGHALCPALPPPSPARAKEPFVLLGFFPPFNS